ncbi:hypothetical protein BHE74_00051051 [Ensete ventricosum]|nr:hypothetical protein BHE74_00051051 [Ensete ventricosum]
MAELYTTIYKDNWMGSARLPNVRIRHALKGVRRRGGERTIRGESLVVVNRKRLRNCCFRPTSNGGSSHRGNHRVDFLFLSSQGSRILPSSKNEKEGAEAEASKDQSYPCLLDSR